MTLYYNSRRGVALIIVLSLIVLVTVVIVAFFSRSALQRQITSTSTGQMQTELLAQGAINTILADLKQEIIDGSEPVASGVFLPKRTTSDTQLRNALPAEVGVSRDIAGLSNLVKISTHASPFYPEEGYRVVKTRASDVTTAPISSTQDRIVSRKRWNTPLLMQPASDTDITPPAEFTAPDWVYVTRSQAGFLTTGETITDTQAHVNQLKNPSASNHDYSVGRFAYVIYDTGGLLDLNVAGFPTTSTNDKFATKTTPNYIDLTQILRDSSVGMTSAAATRVVDRLVAWRNRQSSGNADPNRFFDSIEQRAQGGFIVPFRMNDSSTDGSDQIFTSRQALINAWRSGWFSSSSDGDETTPASLPLSALQYFSTFSRDLDYASYTPEPNRPVLASSNPERPDNEPDTKAINVSFAALTVQADFQRLDGTDAKAGDPLVKRFPLSWLSDIQEVINTPSDSRQSGDARLHHIRRRFGLNLPSVTNDDWTYVDMDENPDSPPPATRIKTLGELGGIREPNFFELLKAAINAGALAKAAVTATGSPAYALYQRDLDEKLDYAIIQIGANIIDQFDNNGFPTRIVFNSRTFRGVEDLPYLYRVRMSTVRTSSPNPPGAGTGTDNDIPPEKEPYDSSQEELVPGKIVALLQPELWNPHAPSPIPGVDVSRRPTTFRFVVENNHPNNLTPNNKGTNNHAFDIDVESDVGLLSEHIVMTSRMDGYISPSPVTLDADFSAIQFTDRFTDSGGETEPFRDQPTRIDPFTDAFQLTGTPGSPSALNAEGFQISGDTEAPKQLGIYLGEVPMRWIIEDPDGDPEADPKEALVVSARAVQLVLAGNPANPTPTNGGIVCRLQYLDPAGNWITYDEKITPVVDKQTVKWELAETDVTKLYGLGTGHETWATSFDPRTSRFGMPASHNISSAPAWGAYDANISGLLGAPNNTGFTVGGSIMGLAANTASSATRYLDRDGISRRAMGAIGASPYSTNNADRPLVLNRPFESVAELGYVFSGTPWRNLDMTEPTSAFGALLDVFTVRENNSRNVRRNGLIAGKINLNTQNRVTLQAVLSGAYEDALDLSDQLIGGDANSPAGRVADALISYTTGNALGQGPLLHLSDFIGRWQSNSEDSEEDSPTSGEYAGFAPDLTAALGSDVNTRARFREAAVRAFGNNGTTRTWNLMIDVITQAGSLPLSADSLTDFKVNGERRYWVHVAIDRLTGEIIDQEIELVKE